MRRDAAKPLIHVLQRLAYFVRVLTSWVQLELGALVVTFRKQRRKAPVRSMVLLADQFPPIVTGGTDRPLSFARYAQRNGWHVTVFTDTPSSTSLVGEKLAASIPSEVTVRRVCQRHPLLPRFATLEVDGGIANALALARCVITEHRDATIVLATAPRFHNFVAGYFIKRILGVRLVLDYRDEWSLCPFDFVDRGQLNSWWERRCLRASDLVIFATPATRQHAIAHFRELKEGKTTIIENGAEEGDSDFFEESELLNFLERDDRFTITATGVLAGHTDPSSFLTTLNIVLDRRPDLRQRVRVLWIGRKEPAQARQLAALDRFDVCRSYSQISQAEARAVMKRSALLLLLVDEETSRCRPGRLYTYMATDRQILVFGGAGESGNIVSGMSAGFVSEGADDEMLEAILSDERVLAAWNARQRKDWIEARSREKLAQMLFDRLTELLGLGHSDDANELGLTAPRPDQLGTISSHARIQMEAPSQGANCREK